MLEHLLTVPDPPEDFRLPPDEMRRIGYKVIDALVDRFEHIESLPAVRVGTGAELEAKLRGPLPEEGRAFDEIMDQVLRDVMPYAVTLAHPRFFAFISSPGNFISTMADALTAGYNPFVGTWLGGSGPSALELVTVDWLRELCGYSNAGGGLFVSGGSSANLTALAVARHVKAPAGPVGCTVYYCDQTHYSNERALRAVGFLREQHRVIPADNSYQMDVDALRERIRADVGAGHRPVCVVATAGTTNVGAVDDLAAISQICAERDMWLHVDGAYGAAAAISPALRRTIADIALADSISMDPHKWLFQPFEIGCILLRDASLLRDTFQIMPDYLKDVHGLGEVNLADSGIQLTRGFRALKLWMSLQYYGAGRFRAAVERGVHLAEHAERELRGRSKWEIVTGARLGIVTFRYTAGGGSTEEISRLNDQIVEALMRDGFAMLSSTVLDGATALRLCTINPSTTHRHIEETLDKLEEIADRILAD